MTPLESAGAFALAAGILTSTPGLDTALVLRTAAVSVFLAAGARLALDRSR
jgi:threonine/homoserine/homoserine lactone efflux protein